MVTMVNPSISAVAEESANYGPSMAVDFYGRGYDSLHDYHGVLRFTNNH